MTDSARPTIDELVVGDDPAAWTDAGFTVDDDGICRVGTVRIRLAGGGDGKGKGILAWSLRDLPPGTPPTTSLEGIPTTASERPAAEPATHRCGVRHIDHLVLMSPDGARTAEEVTRVTGRDVRRIRETESYGQPTSQRFFRFGEVLLELISPTDPAADPGPTRFFGLACTVDDLDALAAQYGEGMGSIKPAVQEGRRIATLRHKALDLSVAIAFMDDGPAAV